MEEYASIRGCIGLELYNHWAELSFCNGDSISYYDRSIWDRQGATCFAVDDAHVPAQCLGGYIVVKAKGLTHKSIMDAIKAGSFYASNGGPEISDFYIEDGIAYIRCSPCSNITFYSNGWFGSSNHAEISFLTKASWNTAQAFQPAKYVYAICTDEKNRRSWTQPIWL